MHEIKQNVLVVHKTTNPPQTYESCYRYI